MQVFNSLALLEETIETPNGDLMTYKQWMTDSLFNVNTNTWIPFFKQYDTIWSKTNFDTIITYDTVWNTKWNRTKLNPNTGTMGWWDTVPVTPIQVVWNDLTQKYDTVKWREIKEIIELCPWFDHMEYVYDQIKDRIDQVWNDSVSYLDLLLHKDGYYAINYKKNYQLNAEYRVYDKKGNSDKTTPHNIVV